METKGLEMAFKFYDHATNRGPMGSVIAKVRAEAIEQGRAYLVGFMNKKGESFYWDGGRYDAIELAKSLVSNGYLGVVLADPQAKIFTADEIKAMKY